MKIWHLKLILLYIISFTSCNKKKQFKNTDKSHFPKDLSVWTFDSVLDTIKKIRPLKKEELNLKTLTNIVNSKYKNKVKINNTHISNDTIYITIKDSEYLTQKMGTTGANGYMITTTFTLTELPNIKHINFNFEFGDHAMPGTYNRDYYLKKD